MVTTVLLVATGCVVRLTYVPLVAVAITVLSRRPVSRR